MVSDAGEARRAAAEIGGAVVVKAQVHAGGRGKAGGVKLAKDPGEAEAKARAILGMSIKGLTVKRVIVARAVDIEKEYYAGIVVDRATKKPVFMVSAAGGIDIEEVARETPGEDHQAPGGPREGPLSGRRRRALAAAVEPTAGDRGRDRRRALRSSTRPSSTSTARSRRSTRSS